MTELRRAEEVGRTLNSSWQGASRQPLCAPPVLGPGWAGGGEERYTHSIPPQRPGQVPSGRLQETQVRVVRSEGISPPGEG